MATLVETYEELKRLRRENRRLRQEREILAKAAAGFAREGSAPDSASTTPHATVLTETVHRASPVTGMSALRCPICKFAIGERRS